MIFEIWYGLSSHSDTGASSVVASAPSNVFSATVHPADAYTTRSRLSIPLIASYSRSVENVLCSWSASGSTIELWLP